MGLGGSCGSFRVVAGEGKGGTYKREDLALKAFAITSLRPRALRGWLVERAHLAMLIPISISRIIM